MKVLITLIIIAAVFFAADLNAQTYGRIYNKPDAEKIYGPVRKAHKIKTEDLLSLISKTNSILMFKITEDGFIVLGNKRKHLFPAGITVDDTVEFKAFSVSVIKELIEKGKEPYTSIEKRDEVISLTNGEYTMEFAVGCPPNCL